MELTGVQLFKNQSDLFKDDENAEDVKMDEIENNILEDEGKKEEDVKDMKINEDLFKDEGNLDDLDNIIDDEEDVKDGEKKP